MFSTRIDPANLKPSTQHLLPLLLKSYPDQKVFHATQGEKKQPVVYQVNVAPNKTKKITLKKSLVRFAENKLAVCETEALGRGVEATTYLSVGTLKVEDDTIQYKAKKSNEKRAVSIMTEYGNAERLSMFQRQLSFFHAKAPVISDDRKNDAVIRRYIPGKTVFDSVIGSFDKRGRLIKNSSIPFTLDQLLKLSEMICSAVTEAHQNEIIIRDIKGENLILEVDESNNPVCVKVNDYGHAKFKDAPEVNENVGTEQYRAPETKFLLNPRSDEKSDAYSIAVLLKTIIWDGIAEHVKYEGDLSPIHRLQIYGVIEDGLKADSNERASIDAMADEFRNILSERHPKMRLN